MPLPEDYKGIGCPNCGTIQSFKTGQAKKSKDCITRPKTCKKCLAIIETIEVPTGKITLPAPAAEVAPAVVPVVQPAVAPVVQPVVVEPQANVALANALNTLAPATIPAQ